MERNKSSSNESVRGQEKGRKVRPEPRTVGMLR